MVGPIVSRGRMGEDCEGAAVNGRPPGESSKLVGREGQLAAPTRMRPDWFHMKVPYRQAEFRLRRPGQCTRLLHLVWIEVDMRVEIGHLSHRQ